MALLEVGCSCFFLLATLISALPVCGTEFAPGAYALLAYAVMCTVDAWLHAAGLGSAVPGVAIAIEWGLWTSLLLFSTLTFERWHALGRATSTLGVAWVATVTLAIVISSTAWRM